jgi:hypothetical protein
VRRGPALLLVLLPAALSLAAQGRTHLPAVEELRKGAQEGVAVGSRGRLWLAPSLARLGRAEIPGGAAQVFSLAADGAGNVYLGTGPDGRIVRLAPGGVEKTLFTVDDPIVTALAFTSGGDLLAGTGPRGKIWRIRPDGTGTLWCETGERYVWALLPGADGSVLAGTGEEGMVLRIDRAGKAVPVFDSEEAHIVHLVRGPDGAVLAAGSGRGLVYRLGTEGTASVVYDDDLPEISDLAVEPDGTLLAAAMAPPPADPRPPAVRLNLPDELASGPDTMTGFDETPRAVLQGVIEGLPPEGGEGGRTRGRLVRIGADGVATELWRSATEAPYALAAEPGGGALLGTGEPGRLYRVQPDGEVALLETLREGQVTGIGASAGAPVIATSNPAAAYRLEPSAARGTYTSPPVDAGGIARWGHLRWDEGAAGAGIEVATRTGNSAQPDGTWSPWAPAAGTPAEVRSPEGRFLQWRVTLRGGAGAPSVSGVSVSFAPRNRPPLLRDFRIDPAVTRAVAREAAFRWSVTDPDGDPLEMEVQFRPLGGDASWQQGARARAEDPSSDDEGMRKDGRLVWDTSAIPEGSYEVRGRVSDQPANPEGRGKDSFSEPVRLEVDRTAPQVALEREADGAWRVRVVDAPAGGVRVEIVDGGVVRAAAAPEDGVADSALESFRLPSGPPGTRVLKVTDAAGNAVERPLSEP